MEIVIMDYQSGAIRTIKDCPDEWDEGQVEDYLYDILGYNQGDIYYMRGSVISHTEEAYVSSSKK